jgi:translation elongation factor EF-1alpha
LIEGLYKKHIDLICIIVSSIPSEFEGSFNKGTVKEDMLLARSVGCKNLLIVWNKIDMNEPTEQMKLQLNTYAKKLRYTTIQSIFVSGYKGDNILSILDHVPNDNKNDNKNNDDTKEETKLSNLININVCFHTSDLITNGYICMLHHITGEYECEVVKIFKKQFIRDDTPSKIKLRLKTKITYSMKDKIILRKNQDTIGFGIILN